MSYEGHCGLMRLLGEVRGDRDGSAGLQGSLGGARGYSLIKVNSEALSFQISLPQAQEFFLGS